MRIEQFVMAYQVDQDRIRAILPEGFESLRPVLRINTEIRNEERAYIEFNTPVAYAGKRGWLNIGHWEGEADHVSYTRVGKSTVIETPFFRLSYTGSGIVGGCPAERDNDGCFFMGIPVSFRPREQIEQHKEFCDCAFEWNFHIGDAHGISTGKTLPADNEEVAHCYEKEAFSAEHAAAIPCVQVLGSYLVAFER